MSDVNLKYLVEAVVFDKKIVPRYKWLPEERKFFGLIRVRKEGLYYTGFHTEPFDKKDLGNDCFFDEKEKVVYIKPRVKLTFLNEKINMRFFDKYQDAVEWKERCVNCANYAGANVRDLNKI